MMQRNRPALPLNRDAALITNPRPDYDTHFLPIGYCISRFWYWGDDAISNIMGFPGYLGFLAEGNVVSKFIKVLGLAACLSTVGVAASFALPVLPLLPPLPQGW